MSTDAAAERCSPLVFSLLLITIAAFLAPRAAAEVTIVRTLPETGTHKAEAEWKSPTRPARIDEEIRSTGLGPRVSGRIIVGGYGSGSEESVDIEDVTTDSQLGFNSYMGSDGVLDLNAQAYRNNGIDRFDQRYNGALSYSSPALTLAVDGAYTQAETLTAAGESEESEGRVGFDFVTSEQMLVPLELHYASSWIDGDRVIDASEDGEEKMESETHSFDLASGISMGTARLDLSAEADIHHDRADLVSSRAYGGTLGLTLPIGDIFSLYFGSSPAYSQTEHQLEENSFEERSVEVDGGLLVAVEERLDGDIHFTRADTWRSDPLYADDELEHTVVWGGSSAWELRYPEYLTSTAEYELGAESGRVTDQEFSAETARRQEEVLLSEIGLRGKLRRSEGELDEEARERYEWGSFLTLTPNMVSVINAAYDGAYAVGGEVDMEHEGELDFSHSPIEEFSYGGGALYAYLEDEEGWARRYGASGNANVMPLINFNRWDFGLAENFEAEERSSGTDYLSMNEYSLSFPIASMLRLRYAFTWEWVDFTSPEEEDGSAFLHSTGISLGGGNIPLSFTSSYLIGHGFRGVQQQVDARMEVPVADSLSMIADMSYRYAENVDYETPFTFSTLVHYEF